MFRKSNKESRVDMFTCVPSILQGGSLKQYSDRSHCNNQFRKQEIWAYCRRLWENLIRIVNFMKQTHQRSYKKLEKEAQFFISYQKIAANTALMTIYGFTLSTARPCSFYDNFINL